MIVRGCRLGSAASSSRAADLGLVGDMIVGVIGSFIGGWLFGHFAIAHGSGLVGELVGATVGAIVLLFAIRLVRRRRVL